MPKRPTTTPYHLHTSAHSPRPRRRRAALLLPWLLLTLLLPAVSGAVVTGTYPSSPETWRVYGKAVQLGASLVTNFTDYRFNDQLLAQSSDSVQSFEKIPADAVIKKAYLFWAGSAPGPIGNEFADQTASLQFTDGFTSNLTADNCILRSSPSVNPIAGKHFYCRKDVTSLLAAHPGNNSWNGSYTVGSVTARVAQITTNCSGLKANQQACPGAQETVCCQPNDPFCQGRHASWSLLIVYDTKFSVSVQRDIFLWDGFVLLDEQLNSLGQINININNFFVGDPPQADLMYYAMEGDKHLGEPIQSSSNCDSTPCGTCFDFIAFNGTKLTGGAGNGDANNIFNSTPETSIDLDQFDISQLVKPKDTSATILVSSGDGNLSNNVPGVFNGYGELVMYGYTVVEVNRLAPNYKNPITKYTVNATEAAPGETLTYTVDLLNSGQLDANPTLLKLDVFPPPGTDYVPGTTLVDGKTIPDVGGTSPISTGLNLGNVTSTTGGNSSRKVQFKVKVKATPGVAEVSSIGKLDYTYKGDVTTFTDKVDTNETVVKIAAPKLATPIMVVSSPTVTPEGTFTYTLSLENASSGPLTVDEVLLNMPSEVNLVSVSVPPGANDQSATNGGSNGTGVVRVLGTQLAAGAKVAITITAKLKSASDLQALGANPLNGYKISAQAAVTVGAKVYQSDDPNIGGGNDPTAFAVSAQANLQQSSKEGLDLSPGTPLSAGDEMQFTITVVNSGPGDVTLNLADPLPAPLQFVSSGDPEIQHAGGVVTASNVAVKAGQTKTLGFKAQILATVQAGTSFSNAATLSPTDGSPPIVVKTGTFTVTGGPDVTTSTKSVQDLNGGALEPGDTVRYTIVINNSGKLPSGTLTVTDLVPAGLEQVSGVSVGGSYNAATNTVTWTVPSVLANGGKRVLTFDAKVAANVTDGTTITNEAIIEGPELKGAVTVATAATVEAKALISTFDLSVNGSGPFKPGDTVTYTLKVRNTGKGPVTGATLAVPLGPTVEFVSASGGGALSGGAVSWSLATIAANAPEQQLTFTVKLQPVLPQGTSVSAQVSLQGQGLTASVLSDDPGTPAPTDPTTFQVTSAPVLTLTKSFIDLNGGSVQGGDTIEFTVEVANSGDSPATAILVTDQLNAAFEAVQVTGGSVSGAGLVSWSAIPSLAPGDPAVTLKVRATVKKSTPSQTQITNQAKATFTETPAQASSNTVSFSVVNQPDFGASTKSVSAATIAAGDAVTWTLEIVNSGNQQGSNVVVTDVVTNDVTDVVAVGGTFNATTRTASWTIASLAAGAKQTLTLQGKVVSPLTNGKQVCNQASITATGVAQPSLTSPPTGDASQIGQATCFQVSSAAKLVVEKRVFDVATNQLLNGGLVKPDAALRYEIVIRNDGNDVASDLQLTDVVPALLADVVPLDGGSFNAGGATVTWPLISSIAPGATSAVTRRFTAKVKPALDNGLPIDNQAELTVSGTTLKSDDPTTAAADDPTRVTVLSNIDLSQATKSFVDDNGGDVRPGDKLTWTISISNQGDAIAKSVVVTDPIDSRLDQVATANGGVFSNGAITWNVGDLAPGASTSLNFSTVVKSPQLDGAEIPNQAQVIAQGFQAPVLTDANLSTAQREPTVVKVTAKADLSGTAWTFDDLNGGTVEPGDELVFTLGVKNTGDALATNTAIKALLSSTQLENLKPFDGGQATADAVDWTVPLIGLSPGGDVPLRFSATVKTSLNNGDKISVAAEVPGVTPNPSLTLDVESKPDLSTSTLAVDDETGWLLKIGQTGGGHTLRVVITLINSGKIAANQVQVSLPLGDLLTDLQLVTPGSTANGVATWTLDKLAAGGSAQFVVRGKVREDLSDGFTFTPTATATPQESGASATLTGPGLTVFKRPILKVTKSAVDATGGQLFPGDTVRFSITVANVGNAPAQQLEINDDLNGIAVVDPVAGSGGTVTGNIAAWTIPQLQVNQTVTVNLDAKVGQAVQPGGSLVNVATAKASAGDPATSNSASIEVNYATLKLEALYVPQAPAQAPVKPGDEVILRAIVTAEGNFDALNSEVSLPIDTAVFEVVETGSGQFNGPAKTVTFRADKTAALKQLKPGQQAIVEVKLRVKSTAPNDTTVSTVVTAREGQTKLSYNSPAATVKIVSIPELNVSKTVEDKNGGKVRPLDLLRYVVTVRVTGKAAALNTRVVDTLPASLELVAVSQGGVADGNKVVWDAASTPALATVKPGDEVKLELEVRVRPEVSDGSLIANQALTTADAVLTPVASDDPKTPTPGDATTVTVRVNNPLDQSTKLAADDNGAPLLVGDTITWTIRVVATAQQPLSGVKVRDPIPAGCVYVPGSTRLNGQAVDDVNGDTTLLTGLLVNTPGQEPGVMLPGQAGSALVSFKTRVSATVLESTTISNIATLAADGVAPVPIGPASLTVGKGPNLSRFDKTAQVIDANGSGQADPGEELLYQLTVRNDGAGVAQEVVIEDPLPSGTAYVATSLALDGKSLTDAKDGDVGELTGGKLVVRVGEIDPGQARVVSFRVRALSAGVVANQAIVRAKGLGDEPSDSDGDDTNGDQPTRTPVGVSGPALQVTKQVQDQNGGDVAPGDWLRYTIKLRNDGVTELKDIAVVDVLPNGLDGPIEDVLLPTGAQWTLLEGEGSSVGTLRVTGVNVRDGETVAVSFRIRVRKDAADAVTICNVADAQIAAVVGDRSRRTTSVKSDPACATVGVASGQSVLKGFVFEDVGALNNSFDPKTDSVFAGWQVLVSPPEGKEGPSISSVTEADGSFRLPQVSAGSWRVRVISPNGTVFLDTQFDVTAGDTTRIDLALKPTGRVYDANRGSLVEGVRLFLHYDLTDPIAPNTLVPEDALPDGQQGQRIDSSGAYLFSAPKGRAYRISVSAGGLPWAFPSAVHPPQEAIAVLAGSGLVTPEALPVAGGKPPYYLRFTRQAATGKTDGHEDAAPPRHNHLPVDALQDAIAIGLHLSKARAQVGEVVHATVTIVNKSNAAIAANPQTGLGGGVLRGLVPRGLALVNGSLRLTLKGKDDDKATTLTPAAVSGPVLEIRRAGVDGGAPLGLNLPVGARLTARFQAVVSATASVGTTLSARAQLFDTAGTALTKNAKADLLVQPDALMDRGTILGKVFCDEDGDGRQGPKEVGVGAARVYIDTGHYSETDRAGRYHLMDIPPGNHLVKLDVNTLPPGSALTTDVKRVVWVTRGLGQRINFGVRCEVKRARADEVVLKQAKKKAAPEPKAGPGVVHVRVNLKDLSAEVDNRKIASAHIRTMLLTADAIRPSPLPVATTPVNLSAGAPLKIAVESEGQLTNHRVVVREVTRGGGLGVTVSSWRFRGAPSPLLVQPLAPDTLTPGRRYAVRVSASDRYGANVWGVWMPLVVPIGDVKQLNWSLPTSAPWVQLNGRRVPVDAKGRADVWIERTGRLIIGMQRSSGEGRNAYMSIGKQLSKVSVRTPKVDDRDDAKRVIGALVADESAAMSEEVTQTVMKLGAAPRPAEGKVPVVEPSQPAKTQSVATQRQPTIATKDAAKAKKQSLPPATMTPKDTLKDTKLAASSQPKTPAAKPTEVPTSQPVAKPAATPVVSGEVKVTQPETPKTTASSSATPPKKPLVVAPAKPAPAQFTQVALDLSKSTGLSVGGVHLKPMTIPVKVRAPAGPVGLAQGKIIQQLVVQVTGVPQNATRAAMVLMDRRGKVRLRTPLSTPLPETFIWDPEAGEHQPLQAGVYGVAFEVLVKGQGGEVGWRTAPTRLELSRTSRRMIPKGEPDKVVRATLFASDGAPTPSMREWITKTAGVIQERSNRIAVVTVHSVAKDAKSRTDAAAAAIERLLLRAGVNPTRLLTLSVGRAIKDSDPQGTALGDDRVEVRFKSTRIAASTGAQAVPYPVSPGYWVNGAAIKGKQDGQAPTSLKVPAGEATLIEAQTVEGPANLWRRSFGQPPGAPTTAVSPQRTDSTLASFGAALYDKLDARLKGGAAGASKTAARTSKDEPKTAASSGTRGTKASGAKATGTKAAALAKEATYTYKTVSVGEAGEADAADLDVYLPSTDKPLGGRVIGIRGRTHIGNKLTINGRKVKLRKDGAFYVRHELPAGGGEVVIEATDKAGHVARLKRSYKVSGRALFLMAIADTALVQTGAQLQGMTERTTLNAGPVQLHGRGAVYMKGRIQGKYLGFKNIRFTAHLDTAKNPAVEDFRSNLFDPDRFYPVYGDGAEDTQDVRARGMLYVLVEADRSKVLLGNFRSGVHGFELLRYDRAMYGGYVELNRKFGAFDTQAKLFVSQEDAAVTRRTDFMRGTGGSLYYLSNRDLLDGSERVWLVVRDRDSNVELARVPQRRNVDYNVDYREGRVVFKSPINSAVDSFFAIGQAGQPGQHLAWNGHPVFVQVTYEARTAGGTAGTNFGAQVQEKLLKGRVTVGATYVQESRDKAGSATFRMAGAHAEVKIGKRSRARAEYAYSESRDSLVSVSDDGGLTFANGVGSSGGHLSSPVSGHALGLSLDADLRDVGQLLGLKLRDSKTAASLGRVRAYYRWVQAGFQSNGVLTEQGQQKVGLNGKLALSSANQLTFRYDGILTGQRRDTYQGLGTAAAWGTGSLATSGSFSPLGRHLLTVQDNHRLGKFTIVGAGQYTAGQDATGDMRHSVTLSGGTNYKVNNRLQLRGEQQLILGGDPNQYQSRYLDHFMTVLGADWRLTDDLHLTVSERIGWGGQNATMAGIRTKLSENSSLYLQQRLEDTYQTGRPMSATVIGAESRYGKDKLSRAWGEYQIDALNVGRMNRAIMGLGKRFRITKGMTLDASYERSQTFSGPSGGLSRDAFSLGFEWLKSDMLKVTSRQEVRVDQGDAQRGGQRKVQMVSLNAVSLRPSKDLELFGRANYMRTQNQSLGRVDAETLQATTGAAWRPERSDWLSVVGKYTHLIENRPAGLDGALSMQTRERAVKHIVSLEPIIETPWRLQLAPKMVFRRSTESMADSPLAISDTWLWLMRFGYHIGSTLDIAAEYRWLSTSLVREHQHGALIEVSYIFKKSLRVGVGYNFTRFVQTVTGDIADDRGGLFLRVIGMY